MKKKIFFGVFSVIMMGMFWSPQGLSVYAEEIAPAGYHEYVETEKESIDHWYGIERGTYLKEGICGIKDAGKGKVSVSGTTMAHAICDTIKVGVYLDESSDGGNSFGQIGSYYFSRENASSCHGSKTDISVKSGWCYMARGGHSAIKGSKTETTTTRTGVLTAS
ncbi:MAG: hypothetical protein HFI21_12365 [Lachnospiraceae bacterium]|nr:hypothetical protein [Lachnospiraceae bacterium]